MAKFKIAVPVLPSAAKTSYEFELEGLAGADAEIVEINATSEDAVIEGLQSADAIYVRGYHLSKRIIEALPPTCRHIATGSVGVDLIDVEAATARNIPVTNVPDVFIEEVANHTMALMLGSFRHLVAQDRLVREGRWNEGRAQLAHMPRLTGLTLGFIAFGHVPREVSRRAKAFGLRMIAYDPYIEELTMTSYDVAPASLKEVLAQSDFISMHAPATPDAHRMLQEQHFRQMKKSAIFINTGRGPTVDEAALIKALQEGWIAGAGLDVLEIEPPKPDNPLLKMENVILTAHVSPMSTRFEATRRQRVGHEISLTLSGRWPMSCVNASVLPHTELTRWQPVSMERGPNS